MSYQTGAITAETITAQYEWLRLIRDFVTGETLPEGERWNLVQSTQTDDGEV